VPCRLMSLAGLDVCQLQKYLTIRKDSSYYHKTYLQRELA
jgi:hypothetical protein